MSLSKISVYQDTLDMLNLCLIFFVAKQSISCSIVLSLLLTIICAGPRLATNSFITPWNSFTERSLHNLRCTSLIAAQINKPT